MMCLIFLKMSAVSASALFLKYWKKTLRVSSTFWETFEILFGFKEEMRRSITVSCLA